MHGLLKALHNPKKGHGYLKKKNKKNLDQKSTKDLQDYLFISPRPLQKIFQVMEYKPFIILIKNWLDLGELYVFIDFCLEK